MVQKNKWRCGGWLSCHQRLTESHVFICCALLAFNVSTFTQTVVGAQPKPNFRFITFLMPGKAMSLSLTFRFYAISTIVATNTVTFKKGRRNHELDQSPNAFGHAPEGCAHCVRIVCASRAHHWWACALVEHRRPTC